MGFEALSDAIRYECFFWRKRTRCIAYGWSPPTRQGFYYLLPELDRDYFARLATFGPEPFYG